MLSRPRAQRIRNSFRCCGNLLGFFLFVGGCWVMGLEAGFAQQQRIEGSRLLQQGVGMPEIVANSPVPTLTTNQLTYDPVRREVVAAGYDKVVRAWPYRDGRIDFENVKYYRWAGWRQQRGTINDFALTSDGKLIAIAGWGMQPADVAIVDRDSGEVVGAFEAAGEDRFKRFTIKALTFDHRNEWLLIGQSNGAVVAWNLRTKEVRGLRAGSEGPSVRSIQESYETGIADLHVSENGTLYVVTAEGLVESRGVRDWARVERSVELGIRTWKAVIAWETDSLFVGGYSPPKDKSVIEIVRLGTLAEERSIDVSRGETRLSCLCLGADSNHLFTTVVVLNSLEQGGERIVIDTNGRVVERLRNGELDVCASRIDEGHVVVSRGLTHAIEILDAEDLELLDSSNEFSTQLNNLKISRDGKFLSFQNEGNQGQWVERIFDLHSRVWATDVHPEGGWLDSADSDGWDFLNTNGVPQVRRRNRAAINLPHDRAYDQVRCHAWRSGQRTRLLLGHAFGVTEWELRDDGAPRVSRVFIGVPGYVTEIVVDEPRKVMYTLSSEGRISAWSLSDWPDTPRFGAAFDVRQGKLVVSRVAEGSPAWDMGLIRGDQIEIVAGVGNEVFQGPDAQLQALNSATPGVNRSLAWSRAGEARQFVGSTRFLTNPTWVFFPQASTKEWILWSWKNYFFDCSTNGADLVGWQISRSVKETPVFVSTADVKQRFFFPERVTELVTNLRAGADLVQLSQLVPPSVDISYDENRREVTIEATVKEGIFTSSPTEVSLWIDDHRIHLATGITAPYRETVRLPDRLRAGSHVLVGQSYSAYGARARAQKIVLQGPSQADSGRQLHILSIGIADFGRTRPAGLWNALNTARSDARDISRRLPELFQGFEQGEIIELLNNDASREAVFKQLDDLKARVANRPDDVLVVFMAGHGHVPVVPGKERDPWSFVFISPRYDMQDSYGTGIPFSQPEFGTRQRSTENVYDKLAEIACHKWLILDCCHSGAVIGSSNNRVIQSLCPEGFGPVILTAADISQESSAGGGNGYLTGTLLDVARNPQGIPDRQNSESIELVEFMEFVQQQVSESTRGTDKPQDPQIFIGDKALMLTPLRPR